MHVAEKIGWSFSEFYIRAKVWTCSVGKRFPERVLSHASGSGGNLFRAIIRIASPSKKPAILKSTEDRFWYISESLNLTYSPDPPVWDSHFSPSFWTCMSLHPYVFLVFGSFPPVCLFILFQHFFCFYFISFIIIPILSICFLTRNRKVIMALTEKEGEEELEGVWGEKIVIIYGMKKTFS